MLDLGTVNFNFSNDFIRMYSYEIAENSKDPQREQIGYFSFPPWRNNAALSVGYLDYESQLSVQTIAAQNVDPDGLKENDVRRGARRDQYNELDFVQTWNHQWDGKVQVGINNLMDTYGGVHNGTSRGQASLGRSMYNYAGRTYFLRVSQNF